MYLRRMVNRRIRCNTCLTGRHITVAKPLQPKKCKRNGRTTVYCRGCKAHRVHIHV